MNRSTPADDFRSQSDHQNIDCDPSLHDPSLQRLLRAHLLALPYGAFLQVVARLLEGRGGLNVRPTGRQGFVGRNRAGGWDIEADLPEPDGLTSNMTGDMTGDMTDGVSQSRTDHRAKCLVQVKSLVQVKQFDGLAVQQRTVDELRGCCLRAGAGRGLILTTSRISPVARAAAQASALAPITLIDGEMLLTLLLRHKLGVRQGSDGGWRIDPEFFRKLGKVASNQAASNQPGTAPETRAGDKHSSQAEALPSRSHLPKPSPTQPSSTQPCQTEASQPRVLHLSITLNHRTGGWR